MQGPGLNGTEGGKSRLDRDRLFSEVPEDLTKAEQKIMEYIVSQGEEFIFMSIAQLSKELEISEATISRFARHVGCRDFKQLKGVVMERLRARGPAVKLAATLTREDSFSPSAWIRQQEQYLQRTLEYIDEDEFRKAAQWITQARRIFIHGKNASAPLAQLLYYRLRRLGLAVIPMPSGGSEIFEGLAQVGPEDMVIMFSLSKVSKEGQIILDYARKRGARTLAFTGRLYEPRGETADIQIYVYRGEEKEYHSSTVPVAFLDALVLETSHQMGRKAMESLEKIQQLKKEYQSD